MNIGDRVQLTLDKSTVLASCFEKLWFGFKDITTTGVIKYLNQAKNRAGVELEGQCCDYGPDEDIRGVKVQPNMGSAYGKGRHNHCVYVHTPKLTLMPPASVKEDIHKSDYLKEWLKTPGWTNLANPPGALQSDSAIAVSWALQSFNALKPSPEFKSPAETDEQKAQRKILMFAQMYGNPGKLSDTLTSGERLFLDRRGEPYDFKIDDTLKPVKVDKVQSLVSDKDYDMGITKFSKSRRDRMQRIGRIYRDSVQVQVDMINYLNPYGLPAAATDFKDCERRTLHSLLGLKPGQHLEPVNMPKICQL